MWLDEARIWTHSPIAQSNEERMRVYTTSTCILLLIKIKEQQPFRSLSIFQHVTPTHMNKTYITIIKLLFLTVLSNVHNLLHPNSLIYNKIHPQTLWKPSLDSLIHIQKTDHWNSDDSTNTRINNNHNNQAEERAPPTEKAFQGRAHFKTDIKETNNIQIKTDIHRNLYKLRGQLAV